MSHRMRRVLSRSLGVALLLATVLVATTAAGAATTAPGATTTTAVPAAGSATAAADNSATYDQLAHCVSTSERLFVVLLVDESGSLQVSDPHAVRVAAAKTALSGLVGLTDQSAGGATVDVQVSVFSNTFIPVGTWTPLTHGSLPTLQTTLDGLAARNKGMDTDYTSALAGAREALSQESVAAGAGSSEACKAIIMFTDGFYDLGVRSTAAERKQFGDTKFYAPGQELNDQATVTKVADLGIKALCDPGGVADQLRADQVTTLAVALTSNMRPSDQAFLQAVVSGKGPKKTCGKSNGSRSGVFLPAFSPAALISTFDTVATRIAGGSPDGPLVSLKTCASKPCVSGQTNFAVDDSLRRVHLFVTVPTARSSVVIQPPSGSPVTFATRAPASQQLDGTTVTSAWPLPTAATIDLALTPASSGTWTVTLLDPSNPAAGSVQVYTFSDLQPTLIDPPALQATQATTLQAQVLSGQSRKVAADLRSATMVAQFTDPITGTVTTQPMTTNGTRFSVAYTPPPKLTSSEIKVVLRLTAITRDGVKLSVTSDPVALQARRPAGYPLIEPLELAPSAVSGKESASASLIVINPQGAAPGCMWVGAVAVSSSPAGVSPVAVKATGAGLDQANCLRVPVTGTGSVQLQLRPKARASGTVTGWLRVWSTSAKGPALPTDIPFTFEMTRGIDKTKQLALFLGLLVLGLGLPLLLLFGMNLVSTRFQAVEHVVAANLPVVVHRDGRVVRVGADQSEDSFHLYGGDFHGIPPSDSTKHFSWAGLRFSARPPINPFGEGFATATPEEGRANVAREGRKVNLALSLAGSWIFLYDPDATNAASRRLTGSALKGEPPEIHGRVLAFIAQGPVPPQAERLVRDIDVRLPLTARRLGELARAGAREQQASAARKAPKVKAAKEPKAPKEPKPPKA